MILTTDITLTDGRTVLACIDYELDGCKTIINAAYDADPLNPSDEDYTDLVDYDEVAQLCIDHEVDRMDMLYDELKYEKMGL